MKHIHLWGVRQNNLKNISVKIPLGSFTVVCGPSGSGKSSLAFETLYAEGQRRYIESLSNYTKQFLNKAPKPLLDGIENIPPSISIEQKNSVKSSRSTVGTTTEVVDYLRVLFEKAGKAYCPSHHVSLEKDSPSSGAEKILKLFSGKRGYLLAPVKPHLTGPASKAKLDPKKLLKSLLQDGVLRIYIPTENPNIPAANNDIPDAVTLSAKGKKKSKKKKTKSSHEEPPVVTPYSQVAVGQIIDLTPKTKLTAKMLKNGFSLVVDRLAFTKEDHGRLVDSLSQAYSQSLKYNSHFHAAQAELLTTDGELLLLSEETSCSVCGYKFPDIHSALFSFNSPVGACETCKGFGNLLQIDEDKVVPNPELTLSQGAIKPFAMPSAARDRRHLWSFCKKNKIDIHKPWKDLPKKSRELLWKGDKDFWGVVGLFEYLETKKYKMHVRVFLARHKSAFTCPDCKGSRLKPEALQVKLLDQSIAELCGLPVEDLLNQLSELKLSPQEAEVCGEPLRQIKDRLMFLCDVGVGYLNLDRPTKTLSGGEFQRLNLSTQLGVGLSQTLYVLDEPTIGLHPRDNDRLISVLHKLNELGNTLVVVEHDHDVIDNASHIIEMGPGSGHLGGTIIYDGSRTDFHDSKESNTAIFLAPLKKWVPAREPRPVDIDKYRYVLNIEGCTGNNLKNLSVKVPLNRIVTVTGVSGSGKSTFVSDTLYPALARELKIQYLKGLPYKKMTGVEHLKNVLFIDQSPVGTTARSCPVTYLKVYDAIRTLMASSSEARSLGFTPSTFSLNVDGGRCPVCKGLGVEIIDMMFMDDLEIPCDACDGKKFRREVLDITYKGKNIHEILNLTVAQAMDFFVQYPNIRRPLSLLKEVGLEYITLGQSARSLSGGESQRLKIAREFNSTDQKSTLYILDEPTTGLHFREVQLLMRVLNRLVDAGGSVLLIEHNIDVIQSSDYLIDLGPEAGAGGGRLVAQGTPLEVSKVKKSLTGRYL